MRNVYFKEFNVMKIWVDRLISGRFTGYLLKLILSRETKSIQRRVVIHL